MRHYTCDKSGESKMTEAETTTLRIRGPMASMINRKEIHVSKEVARELSRWLGFGVADPIDPLPSSIAEFRPGPEPRPRKGRRPA